MSVDTFLARLSCHEKLGNRAAAVAPDQTYLRMKPDALDAPEVRSRIATLKTPSTP